MRHLLAWSNLNSLRRLLRNLTRLGFILRSNALALLFTRFRLVHLPLGALRWLPTLLADASRMWVGLIGWAACQENKKVKPVDGLATQP